MSSPELRPQFQSPSGAPAIRLRVQEPQGFVTDNARPLTAFLDHERLMDCIHCGLCLSQCPTYAEDGHEADSPRGRIYLMRALAEGRSQPTPDLVSHLDSCLGCRACETACPSGVQYGHLLEGTRHYLREAVTRPPLERVRLGLIEAIFPNPTRLEIALLPVRLARRFGIIPLLRKIGVMKLLGRLGDMEAMLPPLPPMRLRLMFPSTWRARGQQQARVGMITGCVMPVMQSPVNYATARVLSKVGCDVEAPRAQVCCGALHAHVGAMDEARALAKKNIEAFEALETDGELDAIVINAAGCGSALKEYGGWFHDDAQWQTRAERFAEKVRDISEWLAEDRFKSRLEALLPATEVGAGHNAIVERRPAPTQSSCFLASAQAAAPRAACPAPTSVAGAEGAESIVDIARETVPNVGGALSQSASNPNAAPSQTNEVASFSNEASPSARPRRAAARDSSALTYHDACHLCHGQGIRQEPRDLLALLNRENVPLGESEMCCGSAGIYNLTQPDMADRLLKRKMEHIRDTGARTVVTGNPGCALQIRAGADRYNVSVEVKHPVELLDKATGK